MDVGEQVLELVDNQQQAVTGLKLRKTTLMFTRHMRQTSILNAYEQPRKVLSRSGTLGEFFVFTADQSVGAPVERADEGNQALTQDALGQRMDELGATVESGRLSAHRDQGGGLVVGTRGDYQADNATLLPIPGIPAAVDLEGHQFGVTAGTIIQNDGERRPPLHYHPAAVPQLPRCTASAAASLALKQTLSANSNLLR